MQLSNTRPVLSVNLSPTRKDVHCFQQLPDTDGGNKKAKRVVHKLSHLSTAGLCGYLICCQWSNGTASPSIMGQNQLRVDGEILTFDTVPTGGLGSGRVLTKGDLKTKTVACHCPQLRYLVLYRAVFVAMTPSSTS